MNQRERLDHEMREVLIQIAVCSHVPAVTYGGGGGSDEHPGGRRPPGDLGPEFLARRYGPPFHRCTSKCKHRGPADTDQDRADTIKAARDELKLIRGRGRAARRSVDEEKLVKRMLEETVDWAPEDVERSRWKMSARMVRRYRKVAGLNIETGQAFTDASSLPPAERRARARAYHEQGFRLSQIATLLGASRSTIERDLGRRSAA